MASPHYVEFELEMGATLDGSYGLSVRSPAGETRRPCALPFAPAELAKWQQWLATAATRSDPTRQLRLTPPAASATAPPAQIFGTDLFNALFADDVASLYDTSRALARQEGRGLRIRLRVADAAVAALPWELLYDPRRTEFLCLSGQTPLVRAVETRLPLETLAVSGPLRMLGMAVGPTDLAQLDLAREQQHLAALAGLPGVELAWTAGPTWRALQNSLQQGPWHIFHFIGHGAFDTHTGEGLLALADEHNHADLRPASQLARLLCDHPTLRLAVLNACEGAQAGPGYVSLGETLVRRGLPATLAMQYPISDGASLEFARSFYGALGNGWPVDAATAEARKAISLAAPTSFEWATPVLFLRSPDGDLWARHDASQVKGDAMASEQQTPWWEKVGNTSGSIEPSGVTGDVIFASIGAGAKNVAVGKNITQTITEVLGPPTPDDKAQIEQQFAQINRALQALQGKADVTVLQFAQMQLPLLHAELTKTGKDETPSASAILLVSNWLLDNLPALREALGNLFALAAAGRVLAKAGETAVSWARQRFGGQRDNIA